MNEEDLSWLSDVVKGKAEAQSAPKQSLIPESRERGEAIQALKRKLNRGTTKEDRHIARVKVVDAGFDVAKGKQPEGLPDAWEHIPQSGVTDALVRYLNSPLIVDKFLTHSEETRRLLEKLASKKISPNDIKVGKDTPRRNWELKQSSEIQQLLKDNRISINTLNKVVSSLHMISAVDWEDLVRFVPQYQGLKEKAENLKAIFKIMKDEKVDFDGFPTEVKLRIANLATEIAEELLQVFGYKATSR